MLFPLCQEVVAQMAPKVMAKQQDISMACPPEMETVQLNGRAFLLEILIRNLIDNASQYTPSQGHIELSLQRLNHQVLLTVQDSGPGVPADQIDKLTDRFYRQHQSSGSGAGLGLALVNSIVTFLGGQLQFKDSPLGGLAVQVRLPLLHSTQINH